MSGTSPERGGSMSTKFLYKLPVEQTQWKFEGQTTTAFTWEYEDGGADLLRLYAKGKKQQWDAAERLDWSLPVDPDNRSEEHTSELQSLRHLVCRLLLEKK